ncbi:helix-turn-helix transcriptional regulator [Acinetobacter sp. MD2(2019)]|uniref:helix-turn-helix transcriptional regulator n=1 Tax=Acinetobacter sp. MD2(2019) TaxID=2605273 RepID=UPI002D1E652C|nr:AlpA family phage regulatory protein [Acinetobacter sp. MD2(2019)]MEB3755173.1 AlpA family phage regulatory protein [Acinetobacter sp. MD2(2019)]
MQTLEKKTHRMMRMGDLKQLIGLSRSSVYDKMNPKSKRYDPSFPRPIKLSLSAVGWFEQDVIDWLNSKKADETRAIS